MRNIGPSQAQHARKAHQWAIREFGQVPIIAGRQIVLDLAKLIAPDKTAGGARHGLCPISLQKSAKANMDQGCGAFAGADLAMNRG